MFRKILVYENVLASEHPALQRAIQLASFNDVELKIIDVVNDPSPAKHDRHRPMRSVVEQIRKDVLDSLCEPLHHRDIPFTTELIRGRPFVEVVREVMDEGFDLVIKTASSLEPNEILGVMGPVDIRLIRNCPCPVWMEVSFRDVRCRQILVAIDPQAEDDDLNNTLLEIGGALAKAAGGQVHVISTWEFADEEFLIQNMKSENVAKYGSDLEVSARKQLDSVVKGVPNPVSEKNIHFHKGSPATAILEFAEQHPPDVLLIGTVGNTNVRGLLIGNTADSVLRGISCPVLAIKPDSLFRV